MYQTFKFYLTRVGLSILLMATFGFAVLYFIHEIAMPSVYVDDVVLQWILAVASLFFGFLVYGMFGEQVYCNRMRRLQDVDLKADEDGVVARFESLLDMTESSFFLPGKGKRFRDDVYCRYADYLLSIGREDPACMKIFLKAFLIDPKETRYRSPLLSLLGRGEELDRNEIDLLLVAVHANDYKDETLVKRLASLSLKKRSLNRKVEMLYLKALEHGSPDARAIIDFILPVLSTKRRSDAFAINFYLAALGFHPPGESQARGIIGRCYCQERWKTSDPDLHERCGEIFSAMEPTRRESIQKSVDELSLFHQVKKIRLFTRNDAQTLNRLKVSLGLASTWGENFRNVFYWIGRVCFSLMKKTALIFLEGLARLGRLDLWVKASIAAGILILGVIGFTAGKWLETKGGKPSTAELEEKGKARKGPGQRKADRLYTIQVAAFNTKKQADRLAAQFDREKIAGVYVVKDPRSSGGFWYKIRVGRFEGKNQATGFANELIRRKIVKNYFLISFPKKEVAVKPKKIGG